MKKKELLAPAGDMDCLRQAVFNGCDAVYLACKSFGARKFATNFSNEEIVEAIKFCHLYGVRLYVTMNTLVKDSEVDDFLEQAYFLHKNGVDALIVQDFGMICLLREKYPNLGIHASTQANTSSKETCQLFYDLGVKRVVFSRELSIEEIDSIDVPIEKEAFIHGALCISYSGCCLMSSMLGGRSGNRGECAGTCRMPFSLEKNGKILRGEQYLLSTKELNTTGEIERLMNSSIYSFKIEGRMKSPLYVGFITRLYRKLIDGEKFNLEAELDRLKTIFNRKFTSGRMFGESDRGLMNTKSPNHVGLTIGKVVDVTKDKIKIELDKGQVINQYDAIRFLNSKKGLIVNFLYDKNMKLVNSSNKYCYVDNKVGLEKGDVVAKTGDYLLGKEFETISPKKIAVKFLVKARLGDVLTIEISDGVNTCKVEEDCIMKAMNAPTGKDSIIKQLGKLGETPFVCNDFEIEMDEGIFIQIKALNEMRRNLVEELTLLREKVSNEAIVKNVSFETFKMDTTETSEKVGINCLVRTREQLDTCLSLNIKRIYVTDRELYELYKEHKNIYLVTCRCCFDITKKLVERSFVSDYFNYKDREIIANYSLNVTNIYTAYYLRKIGLKVIPLSVELTEKEKIELIRNFEGKFGFTRFEILTYGRVCNMVIKGNILDIMENSREYNLIDYKMRKFPVYFDGINTYIYNYLDFKLNKINNTSDVRLDFYNESSLDVLKIVNYYQ